MATRRHGNSRDRTLALRDPCFGSGAGILYWSRFTFLGNQSRRVPASLRSFSASRGRSLDRFQCGTFALDIFPLCDHCSYCRWNSDCLGARTWVARVAGGVLRYRDVRVAERRF